MTTYAVDGVSYSSMNAAFTEIETNHDYGIDGIADVVISITSADSTAANYSGASAGTPDSSNYCRVRTTGAARHDGTYDTGAYRLEVSSGAHCLEFNEDFFHIIGVAIKNTSSTSSAECIRNGGCDDTIIEKCYLETNNIGSQDAIHCANVNVARFHCFDNAITVGGSSARSAIMMQPWTGSITHGLRAEHNSINVNGAAGGGITNFQANNNSATYTWDIDNNVVWDTGTFDDYYDDGTGSHTWSGQGNIASDTSATGKLGATNNHDSKVVDADNDSGTDVQITTVDVDYQIIDGLDNGTAIDAAIAGATRDSRIDLTTDCAGNSRPGTFTDRDIGAFEVVAAGLSGTINQATETDLSQPLGKAKQKAIGQATETDLAQPITEGGAITATVVQALETDSAHALAGTTKVKVIGQATETDLAQPISGSRIVSLAQALETDIAQPIAGVEKTKIIGTAVETDLAQPIAGGEVVTEEIGAAGPGRRGVVVEQRYTPLEDFAKSADDSDLLAIIAIMEAHDVFSEF